MKQRGSIMNAFLVTLVVVFVVIFTIGGLLGCFNVIGRLPEKWEINFPQGYTDYEIKKMPIDLPKIEPRKDYFSELKIYDQKRTCFFEIESNQRLLTVKIWTILDDVVFYKEKTLKAPLTDKLDYFDPILGADKLVIWLN